MTDLQESLSEREIKILACLVEGISNREIASRLHLAYQTVKGYNSEIYGKLGVSNRDDAIERATELGFLETESDIPQPIGKHNLPESVTEFVGRRHEISELQQLIDSKRLVTILAPGGMGKTTPFDGGLKNSNRGLC
jgi:ATP/maltotriose-dependent transcriptional regulator MalT